MSAVTVLVVQVGFLCLQANCTSVLIFMLLSVAMVIGTLACYSEVIKYTMRCIAVEVTNDKTLSSITVTSRHK